MLVLRVLQCKESGLSSQKEKEWVAGDCEKEEEYFEHFDDAYFHEQMR